MLKLFFLHGWASTCPCPCKSLIVRSKREDGHIFARVYGTATLLHVSNLNLVAIIRAVRICFMVGGTKWKWGQSPWERQCLPHPGGPASKNELKTNSKVSAIHAAPVYKCLHLTLPIYVVQLDHACLNRHHDHQLRRWKTDAEVV